MSSEQTQRMNQQMKSALESHPKSRLLLEIRKNNVKGYSKLTKPDLIKLMMNEENIEKFRYIKDAKLEKALKREEEKDKPKPKPEPKKEEPKPKRAVKKNKVSTPPSKLKPSPMAKLGETVLPNGKKVKDMDKEKLFKKYRSIYLKYYGRDVPYQNFMRKEKEKKSKK